MSRFPIRQQLPNLLLIAAAAALCAVVFLTRNRATSGETEARARHLLRVFRADEIGRITLARKSQQIVLVRERDDAGSSSFRLTAPVTEPADAYAVDKLLGALEFATRIRSIEPSQVDRGRFGLNAPEAVIELAMGSVQAVIRVGAVAASPKDARYLELLGSGVPDPGVVLVSADVARELMLGPDELRDKLLVPYGAGAAERLLLDGAGGPRALRRPASSHWRFDGQEHDRRVDRTALDALWLELARAKAEHFLTEAQALQSQQGAATVRVEVLPRDRSLPRAVVTFGGPCPASDNGVVAAVSAPRRLFACVPRSVLPGLAVPAERLLDTGLIALRADEIEHLELEREGRQLTLTRTKDGFMLRTQAESAVELDVGNQRLAELAAARGRLLQEPDLNRLGLNQPEGTLKVGSATSDVADGLPSERLRFSARSGAMHVLREQDGAVLELDADAARALSSDLSLLRPRRVLDFKPGALQSFEIRGPELLQRASRDDSGGFRLIAPEGQALDAGLTSDLVDALATLSTERWIAERQQPGMGLERPRLRIELALAEEGRASRRIGLVVGAPTSDGYYAKLDGDDAVFALSRAGFDRLSTLLLDRSVFLLDAAATRRIELAAGGRSITLEKSGDRFEALPGGGALRPEQIAEIVATLSALRPEAAVHLGPAKQAEGLARPALSIRVVPENGPARTIAIGAADSFHDMSVRYARTDGSAAIYVVATRTLAPLLDHF